MTKEEFEKSYLELNDMEKERYDKSFVTLPCNCGDDSCRGWACVANNPESIEVHNCLYN